MSAARDELAAAVDELTLAHKLPAPSDTDPGRHALVDPLLVALEQSRGIATAWIGRRGGSVGSERPPVRLSVSTLLGDVDRVVGSAVGSRAGTARVRRVRSWSARMLSSPSYDALAEAAELASRWVGTGRAFFAPPRWRPLRNAGCPSCGHTHARGLDEAGDEALDPALVADMETGRVLCTIDGCGAAWDPDHLELLAAALDVQTGVEVLAVE